MSRYIDAEALKRILLAKSEQEMNKTTYPHSWSFAYLNFVINLEAIQTADVEPVRHGHWKQLYQKSPRYVCTFCNHLFNNREWKYCPHCGAKMDGKE